MKLSDELAYKTATELAMLIRRHELSPVEDVKLGIQRDHRELSELWCRLITPIDMRTFESFKEAGIDLLRDHRDDFSPQYLEKLAKVDKMSVIDLFRDQEMRPEIYNAIQGVLADYDLLVTPTVACLPVDNTDDGNTLGPTEINGEALDPLIGWCLTYLINFTGHPAASIPAGL